MGDLEKVRTIEVYGDDVALYLGGDEARFLRSMLEYAASEANMINGLRIENIIMKLTKEIGS